MSIESVMPSNHLILCHPLLLPSILPSIRIFFSESVLRIKWPKYWSFSFSLFIHSSQWIFRTDFIQDWLVWSPCNQRDSKESSPAPSSKASILQHSAFFMVQFSHPYMITRKTTAFTIRTFVCKVMSLLFNMLSSLVMATQSSTLAWKSPWTEEPGRLQYMGSQRVRHDWATSLHFTSFQAWS